jgi:hypothetical protein
LQVAKEKIAGTLEAAKEKSEELIEAGKSKIFGPHETEIKEKPTSLEETRKVQQEEIPAREKHK